MDLHLEPANTVIVVMSNDETNATRAWKTLVANSLPNVYILEGGINYWLSVFAQDENRIRSLGTGGDDELRYDFIAALGSAFPAAQPDPQHFQLEFTPKVEIQQKRAPASGGCG